MKIPFKAVLRKEAVLGATLPVAAASGMAKTIIQRRKKTNVMTH